MDAKQFKSILQFINCAFESNIAIDIWGENLGEHIWNKFINFCNMYGSRTKAMTEFICALDNNTFQKLIDYVIKK